MKKLLSLSCYTKELEFLFESGETMKRFLEKHRFDGIEALQLKDWPLPILSNHSKDSNLDRNRLNPLISGVHLTWIPIWLDFWKNDRTALLRQFGHEEAWRDFYGGLDRHLLVRQWQEEVQCAIDTGAEYVVFHIGHVELEHCYTYEFTYSNAEVVKAAIELVNQIFNPEILQGQIAVLFENVWWPGLTLLDGGIIQRLMQDVKWRNKGIMLDLGHLMNTNLALTSEEEAIEYFQWVMKTLGEHGNWIRGVHLNSSLSGGYVKQVKSDFASHDHRREEMSSISFTTRYFNAFPHISRIDEHKWFQSNLLKPWLESLKLEWLVYEFREETFATMSEAINQQNIILEL